MARSNLSKSGSILGMCEMRQEWPVRVGTDGQKGVTMREGAFASSSSIPLSICFSYHRLRLVAIKHLQTPFPELWESSLKMFSYGFPAEYFSNKTCSVIESIPWQPCAAQAWSPRCRQKVAFCLLLPLPKPGIFCLSSSVLSNR